jgi:hypothetical protein
LVAGLRAMMDLASRHSRLEAAGVQSAGAQGHGGFLIATVVGTRIP